MKKNRWTLTDLMYLNLTEYWKDKQYKMSLRTSICVCSSHENIHTLGFIYSTYHLLIKLRIRQKRLWCCSNTWHFQMYILEWQASIPRWLIFLCLLHVPVTLLLFKTSNSPLLQRTSSSEWIWNVLHGCLSWCLCRFVHWTFDCHLSIASTEDLLCWCVA